MPAPYALITAQAVPGNSDVALMARVRGQNFNLVTQASLLAINYALTDLALGANLGAGTFAISSVWFDSLQQQDGSWTKDGPANPGQDLAWGYNFKAILPYSLIPIANSGNRMQADVYLTPVIGGRLRIIFQFPTLQVYG